MPQDASSASMSSSIVKPFDSVSHQLDRKTASGNRQKAPVNRKPGDKSSRFKLEKPTRKFEKNIAITDQQVERLPVAVRSVAISDLFVHAWKHLLPNFWLLVGLTFLLLILALSIGLVLSFIPAVVIRFPLTLVANLLFAFVGIGLVRIYLRICRNHEITDFKEVLLSGADKLWPYFGLLVVGTIIGEISPYLIYLPNLIFGFLFWPAHYLIADNQCSLLASFGYSIELVRANIGTTIVLILVSAVLILVGGLLLGLGLLVAMPFVFLVTATAYLAMAGQI